MLPHLMSRLLSGSRGVMRSSVQRNFGASAVALKELDPIQTLFVQKIKAYAKASKEAGTDLVDASTETLERLDAEMDKLAHVFNAATGGMDAFPQLVYEEPLLDPLATELVEGDLKKIFTSS